jgi:hypothetical protein
MPSASGLLSPSGPQYRVVAGGHAGNTLFCAFGFPQLVHFGTKRLVGEGHLVRCAVWPTRFDYTNNAVALVLGRLGFRRRRCLWLARPEPMYEVLFAEKTAVVVKQRLPVPGFPNLARRPRLPDDRLCFAAGHVEPALHLFNRLLEGQPSLNNWFIIQRHVNPLPVFDQQAARRWVTGGEFV